MRAGGVVRDAAVLSANLIGPDERRRVLGVSVALSEAEVHWRTFLDGLSRAACAALNSLSPTITSACAALAEPYSAPPPGSVASFAWPPTPSITNPIPPSVGVSGPSCAASGMPTRIQRPKPRSTNSSPTTATHLGEVRDKLQLLCIRLFNMGQWGWIRVSVIVRGLSRLQYIVAEADISGCNRYGAVKS